MSNNILYRARLSASVEGGNEPRALNQNEGLRELFFRRQEILAAMNAAKMQAIAEAVKPFQHELDELDKQYSMVIMMLGDNAED